MFQTRYGLLSLAVSVLALQLAGCGSTPVSKFSGNPGGTGNTIASGPVLGSWWDSSAGGLRTVYGVAGAAYQGPAIYNGGEYSGAAVCMRANIALLTTSSGALYVTNVRQGVPVQVTNLAMPKAQIVFSPSCDVALGYGPDMATAVVIRGILSSGRTSVTLTIPAGTAVTAISDAGSVLVSVPGANGSSSIRYLAPGGDTWQPVVQLSAFGGMAFLPGGEAALIADAGKNTLIEASQMTTGATLSQVAGVEAGFSHPVAVAVSADGHAAAVANQAGSIIRIDLSGQTSPVRTICACAPTELQPLAGNLVFRLNEAGAGTVWAYDGDAARPRVVFIPTDQVANRAFAAVKGAGR